MANYRKFGELLKKYLWERDRPQIWLARQLDVSNATVSRWLNEEMRPGDAETVIRAAGRLSLKQNECEKLLEAAEYPTTLKHHAIIFKKGTTESAKEALEFISKWLGESEGATPSTTAEMLRDHNESRSFIETALEMMEPQHSSQEEPSQDVAQIDREALEEQDGIETSAHELNQHFLVSNEKTSPIFHDIRRFFDSEGLAIVEAKLPHLTAQWTSVISEGLMENALRSGLLNWRGRKVRAIADIEQHVETLALIWLQLDTTKEALDRIAREWIATIWGELIPLASDYELPDEVVQAISDFRLSAYGIAPATIDSYRSFRMATDVASVLSMVTAPIIVMGVALSVGIVPYFVAVAAVAVSMWKFEIIAKPVGAIFDQADKSVYHSDLPKWVRKGMLSDKAIERMCTERRPEVTESIRNSIINEQQKRGLASEMVNFMRQNIERKLAVTDM